MWKWRRLGVVVAVVGLAALLPVSLAQTVTFPREEFSQDVLEATAEFRTGSLGLDASQLLSAIDPIIDDFSSLFADDPTLAADFQDDLELALELSASRSQFDLELFQQLVEIALDRLAVARLEFELFFVVENNFDQAGIRLDQINLKARVSDLANGLIANSDIRADFIENVNTVIDRSVETVGTAAASDQGRQIVMTDVLELGLQAALERLDRDNIQQRLPALADRLLGGVATLSDRVRFQEALMLLLRRLDVTRNLIRGDNRDLQDALLGRAVVRRGEVGTLGTRGRRPTPVVRGGATVIDQQSPLPLAPRPLLPSTGLHQPQSRVARLETQLLTA
ncbi:MAG: hypothetical protein HY335_08635, partial [Deinococcus sp.]|nr:hypothetical protein [Deinococcus sp.]